VVHIIHSSWAPAGSKTGWSTSSTATPPGRYRHAIVCLTEAGEFANRITAPGRCRSSSFTSAPVTTSGSTGGCVKTLRTLRPAIVHTRNLATLEMQFVAALLPGVKHVHGEHGRDVFDLHGTNRKYNLLRKAARLVVQRYIAVSKDLEQWLDRNGRRAARRVRQIYNGVDQHKFHPGAVPGPTWRRPASCRRMRWWWARSAGWPR
jgi:hypothetical protein